MRQGSLLYQGFLLAANLHLLFSSIEHFCCQFQPFQSIKKYRRPNGIEQEPQMGKKSLYFSDKFKNKSIGIFNVCFSKQYVQSKQLKLNKKKVDWKYS